MMAVKPRRKWPRRVAAVLFVLAVLLFFAPVIVARTGIVQAQARHALADFDGELAIGSVRLGWFSNGELSDVVLKDAQGRTLLNAPLVSTHKTLLNLIADAKNVGTVTVQRPAVNVICEGGTTNWEQSLAKLLASPGGGPAPTIAVEVTNATLTIVDASVPHVIEDVNVVADVKAKKFALVVPHKFNAEVTLAPLTANLQANGFPLEPLGPLLRRFEPGLDLRGTLRGTALTTGDTVEGHLAIEHFRAASTRLGVETLALDNVELPFRVKIDGDSIRVELAELACPVASATFIGTLDISKPETLLQQPGVTATAKVDLAKLAQLLPGLMKLQAGTQITNGKLEARLESKAGEGRPLWQGHVKTSSLRGTRGGQPLAWNEPVIATFAGRIDDAFRPDFTSLAVASDFLRVNASGTLEKFNAEGLISLDLLAGHLSQFIDMTGLTLAGQAMLNVQPPGNIVVHLESVSARGTAWQFAGNGDLHAVIAVANREMAVTHMQGDLQNVRFRSGGLDVDEPVVKILDSDVRYHLDTGRVAVPKLQLTTQTVAVGAASDGHKVETSFTADLSRVQKAFAIAGEPLAGVARGRIVTTLDTAGKTTVTAKVRNFRYGHPNDPLWAEPNIDLSGEGNFANGVLSISSSAVSGLQGLGLTAKGTLSEVAGKPALDLAGDLAYELDKLQPKLRAFLGNSFAASGYGTRPFHLKGDLDNPTLLVGDASVAWKSLSAYGFDVGASQLNAKVEGGTLTTSPIEALFGGSGKVKLEPVLRFQPNAYDVVFKQGRVIEQAKLTPKACAEALGFALPALAKSAQAEGTISFDLAEHRILLMNINGSTLKGTLTLHNASVTAGPVIGEVAKLFGDGEARLVLAKEQPVNIRIEKGRVYHDGLKLASHGFTVTTSGSVGFDGTLSLTAEVPLPEKAVSGLLKNNPAIRDAMAKQKVTIPIGGTLNKPALDRRAFDAAVAAFIRDVTKDAAKSTLDGLFQKGLEKALPKKP